MASTGYTPRKRWSIVLFAAIVLAASGAALALARDGSESLVVVSGGPTSDSGATTPTSEWVSPCVVTVPPGRQGDPEAVAKATAEEARLRDDLGEICLSPEDREKVGELQAAADAAKRADPSYKPGPDFVIPEGVQETGLLADGEALFPAVVFVPTNEWVAAQDGGYLFVIAGFTPASDDRDSLVAVDTGAVVIAEPNSSPEVFRANGIGRLRLTGVQGGTAHLTTSDGKTVAFDISTRTFKGGS